MQDFTSEQAHRWDEWQRSNDVSSKRSMLVAKTVGALVLVAALMNVVLEALN